MNPDTEAILTQMGLIPFDSTPDQDDGTLAYFKPDAEKRPKFSVKIYPKTTPAGLFDAIWRAGAEEKKQEISRARSAYLAALS